MKYALINGILLDGTETMQPRPGLSILVNGDRIEAIVPAGTEGSGYERIDLAGGYVMPGLINLHVHLPASGRPTVKQKDTKRIVRLMTSNALLRAITFRVCAGYAKTELLSGVKITDDASLRKAAETLLDTGLHRVFISLGSDGVFAADHSGQKRKLPALKGNIVSTTGCGDAFMAALAWAHLRQADLVQAARAGLQGSDLEKSARAGRAASTVTMASAETISAAMSEQALLAHM